MILCSDEEIAKDIEVMDAETGSFIRQVEWVDFEKHMMGITCCDIKGNFMEDDLGRLILTYRRKIIPVYKGK